MTDPHTHRVSRDDANRIVVELGPHRWNLGLLWLAGSPPAELHEAVKAFVEAAINEKAARGRGQG